MYFVNIVCFSKNIFLMFHFLKMYFALSHNGHSLYQSQSALRTGGDEMALNGDSSGHQITLSSSTLSPCHSVLPQTLTNATARRGEPREVDGNSITYCSTSTKTVTAIQNVRRDTLTDPHIHQHLSPTVLGKLPKRL